MTMMYSKVSAQERKIEKYRTNAATTAATTTGTDRSNNQQREKIKASRQIANQAAFWIGAFLLSYIFGFIVRLMELIQYSVPEPFWALFTIFSPSQGFLNSLVYFRPIYMKRYPDSNITACLTCRCGRWMSCFINIQHPLINRYITGYDTQKWDVFNIVRNGIMSRITAIEVRT